MHTLLATTLLALVPSDSPGPAGPRQKPDPRTRYVELAAKHDADGCQALWRENRRVILSVIDADLEGSLKVREDAGARALTAEEEQSIAEMHHRALWGARQAAAVGHALVLDYASSFVGWDEAQRKDFRAGQKAYGEARAALKKGDAPAALAAGRRCRELAVPLGDWWGAQMGWEAEARAHELAGAKSEALAAWSQARLVSRAVSLVGDEYEATTRVAFLAADLGRVDRARAAVGAALELGRELGDAPGVEKLEALARDKLGAK